VNETPAVANVAEHARIVAGCAHQRRLVAVLQSFAAEGKGDVGDPLEWGQRVEQGIYEAARWERGEDENGSLAAVMPGVIEQSERQRRGEAEPPGILTGFAVLDQRINGLKRAKTYIVAGRPGMGKSALIGQIATNIAWNGMMVVEISTEQKRDELARRKLAQCAIVTYTEIESGKLRQDEWDRVRAKAEHLRAIPLSIEDPVKPTIAQLRGTIRRALARLRRVHGDLPVGLISVDQIGQLNGERQRGESQEQVISRLSQELAWMAGEFDAPMLVAAQLNRAVESRPDKRPNLSDLRDSGALEQDAYGVLFPFRPAYYDKDRKETNDPEACELIIAKHKNGPGKSVPLEFHGPSMSFMTVEDRS
jgi:replicative DNA helicase